ncbi:hypothetical protein ACB092_04G028200 [Castanea dentata]
MGKRGKVINPTSFSRNRGVASDDIDKQFHNQRDIIPLDANGDIVDSDDEMPVFDLKGISDDEDEDDETGDIAKSKEIGFAISCTAFNWLGHKYLPEKFGGVEDAMLEDDEEEQESLWGGKKKKYYHGDNADYEEEEVVKKLQVQKAESYTIEDFGFDAIEDCSDPSDRGLTLEPKEMAEKKYPEIKEAFDDTGAAYEEVKKDLSALLKEEQMDVLYSSAPELVGLLSELNDAIEQLEKKVDPLLSMVKREKIMMEGGVHYLEMKQLLLLLYCQAITFYLLLKSEGQPICDHPVLVRLVEIKSLLDKTKQLDGNLPSELEEFLNNNQQVKIVVKLGRENTTLSSDSVTKDQGPYPSAETQETTVPHNTAELENVEPLKDSENKAGKRKRQSDQVGVQSMEMLEVRAALEERLKQEGILSSRASKSDKAQKRLKPVNGKLSQIVSAKTNKPKVVSGDDDLPKRDDIGERPRKHELRDDVVDEVDNFEVDGDADMGDGDTGDSEDEYYKQAEQRRAAKLAAKADVYSRTSAVVPSSPEPIDGKCYITYEMEKNRGLTWNRKNQTKNPRKKYKEQHKKKVNRQKGQVQEIKKPVGPYGGEASGINVATSRSVRFKN